MCNIMPMNDSATERPLVSALILTYAGTLPFIAAALATILHFGAGHARLVIGPYGAVILAFLAGTEWGTYLNSSRRTRLNLLITSNLFALAAWVSLLVFDNRALFACEAVLFALLLLVDLHLRRAGQIAPWIFRLRLNATLIVEACLLALIVVG